MFVYVLKLKENKWFVGRTRNIEKRISDHFDPNKHGSYWTDKYEPIETLKIVRLHGTNESEHMVETDEYTMFYMHEHGIDNVRGGSFCNMFLKQDQICTIQTTIRRRMGLCLKCGSKNHSIENCDFFNRECSVCGRDSHCDTDCFAKKDVNGNYVQK